MVAMVAKVRFPYAGRTLKADEEFVAESARDAKILEAIGKAVPKAPPVESKTDQKPDAKRRGRPPKYETKNPAASGSEAGGAPPAPAAGSTPAAVPSPALDDDFRSRHYHRRDMEAE